MIVHAPTMSRAAGEICISAYFEFRNKLPYLPNELWYRFPETYAARLAPRADGFAATALLMAMYVGEDLTIRGPLSPKLAYGLLEYRSVFHSWLPKLFQMIDIRHEQLQEVPPITGESGVATAFSGGVDSFYTLWSHLPENQPVPAARVTHGLFVHGLDLRLDDSNNYGEAAQRYAELYSELGLELLLASTNAYQFSEFRINWRYIYGPPLFGAALLMSPFLRRFYSPSGMHYLENRPNGSTPLTDHWLCTETQDIIHHGASIARFDKLVALTQWPLTYHHLRVCSDKHRLHGVQNCSACDKCYRTICSLAILDALPRYKNFSSRLNTRDYIRWGLLTYISIRHVRDVKKRAWRAGRVGLAFLLQLTILLGQVKTFLVELLKKTLSREQLYRIKRRIYSPESQI